MNPYKKYLTIFILFIAALVSISGKVFFPFSSYPMFSPARKAMDLYTIVVEDFDGRRSFIKPHELYPFSRLHLAQMIKSWVAKSEKKDNFEWVNYFVPRIQKIRQHKVKSIHLSLVTFPYFFKDDSQLVDCDIKTLYTIDLTKNDF